MTANLLVLEFVDKGKLTVEDAVQLLETIAEETEQEDIHASEKMIWVGVYPPTHIIFSAELN
jgi:polyhydroxyalkanoate synthesis regulator phasin